MATTVSSALALDEVLFVVANDPWQKTSERVVTPAAVRLEMVQALVDDQENFTADDREIRRGGPTYTVDTLRELHAENLDCEIFLIVGADTASRIHTWHEYGQVLALSTLVVVNRTAASPQLAPEVAAARVEFVSMPAVDVSSTLIRDAVAAGTSIDAFTSQGVCSVIAAHRLYRKVDA
jgi:nicotinate-nucleotide adenylyltransferase